MSHWTPPDKGAPHPSEQTPWLNFSAGLVLSFGLHLLVGLALGGLALISEPIARSGMNRDFAYMLGMPWLAWLMGVSVIQVLYLGPAWLFTRRFRPSMAHGVLAAMVITLLLQGSCYAFFMMALSSGIH